MAVRSSCAAAFVSILALAPAASAQDALGTTGGLIVEKSHVIELTVSRGHARMRVVREIANESERSDQAVLDLFLPRGAVATGLRTRAIRNGQAAWYEGELLEAELARRRYEELTGIGDHYPKDRALLYWRAPGHLALQVSPCPPKGAQGVGYDLELPTRWVEGRERVDLGPMGVDADLATVTLRTDVPGGKILVDGAVVAAGSRIRLEGGHDIEVEPPSTFGAVDGRLGAVSFAPDRSLVALRIDAPRAISQVPAHARVVVALDTSRSLAPYDVAAEMRAGSAYLSHFEGKDARVAVVAYDRHARNLTHGFVTVAAARALLDGPTLPRANGSAIDDAVALAGVLLAAAPSGSPKRVVVLGDLLTRRSLAPDQIAAPRGAIVHVASVSYGGARVERDDDDAWAVLPRATGGLLFRASAPSARVAASPGREDLERAFLEWARPVRIDRMVWRMPGVSPRVGEDAGVLQEGGTIEYSGVQPTLPASATIEGELWSKRFEQKVFASASESKLWSALVFGTDMMRELNETEMGVLARAGGAVSPITSYLAAAPGVPPSNDGPAKDGGLSGICGCEGRAIGQGIRLEPLRGLLAPDYQRVFASWMKRAVRMCGGEGRTTIVAETTLGEIVDVDVEVGGDGPDGSRAGCVREAAWALELPDELGHPHLDLNVSL